MPFDSWSMVCCLRISASYACSDWDLLKPCLELELMDDLSLTDRLTHAASSAPAPR